MINWYQDNKLAVYFSDFPDVGFNYPKNKDEKCKKPFILKNEIEVTLWDYDNFECFEFIIPKNYCWDGASIPRVFWRIIGSKETPEFLIASLVHDVLCENHGYVNNDRYFSTLVFERLLYKAGVSAPKRWLMKHGVDNAQKLCAWSKN